MARTSQAKAMLGPATTTQTTGPNSPTRQKPGSPHRAGTPPDNNAHPTHERSHARKTPRTPRQRPKANSANPAVPAPDRCALDIREQTAPAPPSLSDPAQGRKGPHPPNTGPTPRNKPGRQHARPGATNTAYGHCRARA